MQSNLASCRCFAALLAGRPGASCLTGDVCSCVLALALGHGELAEFERMLEKTAEKGAELKSIDRQLADVEEARLEKEDDMKVRYTIMPRCTMLRDATRELIEWLPHDIFTISKLRGSTRGWVGIGTPFLFLRPDVDVTTFLSGAAPVAAQHSRPVARVKPTGRSRTPSLHLRTVPSILRRHCHSSLPGSLTHFCTRFANPLWLAWRTGTGATAGGTSRRPAKETSLRH